MERVAQLQSLVLNMTDESYDSTIAWIFENVDIQDREQTVQILQVILIALEYRPKNLNLLVRFSGDIVKRLVEGNTPTPEELMVAEVFNPVVFFSSVFAMFARQGFIYHGLVTPERMIRMMRIFKTERSESVYEYLTFFCWFCPEIEQYDPELFNELMLFFKKKSMMPNLLSSLKIFIDNIDNIRADNWKLHKEMTESLVGLDPIAQAILRDDLAELQSLREKLQFDVNARLKPDIFCVTRSLQRHPTLLQACGFLGAEKCFEYLLNEGADTELCNYANRTLAQFVVAGGNRKIVEMALSRGCNFNGALQAAALYHRNDIFYWLYETTRCDLSAGDENLGTVLHQAAKSDNIEIVKFCVEHGVDVNIRNSERCTPLHFACECESINAERYLLSLPEIEVNARDVIRRTPLHNACDNGNTLAVQLLLDHKDIDINAKNKEIQSPLMCAVIGGRKNTVRLLLSNPDIDMKTIDGAGMTPLHWAARNNRMETMKVLIEKLELDINTKADNGKTALHWASVNGFVDIMKLLLLHPQIDVNARADEGATPIHAAMQGGHIRAIKELVQYPKTDINTQNAKGQTALHMAAAAGNLDILRVILSCKRINTKLKTKDGATAHDIAKQYNNTAVVDFLSNSASQGDVMVFVTV